VLAERRHPLLHNEGMLENSWSRNDQNDEMEKGISVEINRRSQMVIGALIPIVMVLIIFIIEVIG
jgi:hypothetical protein